MTFSSLTDRVRESQQRSSRDGTKIDRFLVHHQAGTDDDAVVAAMVSGARQVSANYTISNEGRITGVVPEEYRAWTSGSSFDGGKGAGWDRRSITVEVENSQAGDPWPISVAAYKSLSELVADVGHRYGFPIHRNGAPSDWTVLGHRELWEYFNASYSTACPGGISLSKVVTLANQEGLNMDYRVLRTQGNPALFADFNGLVIRTNLNTVQLAVTRAGTGVEIYQPASETEEAAILADWERQRKANLAAIGSAMPKATVDVTALAAALAGLGFPTVAQIAEAVVNEEHDRLAD